MHDQTAVRSEGIAEQFHRRPKAKAKVDSGFQGLANEFPPDHRPAEEAQRRRMRRRQESLARARRRQSSARICVEHTNAALRQWTPVRRLPNAAKPTRKPNQRSWA
ncbi:hypothetical protein ABZ070_36410 [Streptomyces sp. NPDC006283]|uniref:hypothetical protein n=1 Tax=Streptomyces sp. NPDC006283 TaxID=3156741 RepID=UPI0033A231D8